jgi:hypothetical protein
MIPERDVLLTKFEVENRRRLAAEERAAREARRARATRRSEQTEREQQPHGRFGWLRRLAGARN